MQTLMSSSAGFSSQPGWTTFTLALLDLQMLKLAFKPTFILNTFMYVHMHVHAHTHVYIGWVCWFQGLKHQSSSHKAINTHVGTWLPHCASLIVFGQRIRRHYNQGKASGTERHRASSISPSPTPKNNITEMSLWCHSLSRTHNTAQS